MPWSARSRRSRTGRASHSPSTWRTAPAIACTDCCIARPRIVLRGIVPRGSITAVHLLRAGYPVLRLNLRGAGGSETQQFYHAGRTEDLKRVIGSLDGRLAANGVVPVGFSLGANMMLKYLAECGAMAPVLAAVSISAPIDLAAAQRRIARRRNRVYQQRMLEWLRSERGVRLPPQLRTMIEFDTHVVAPAN